MSELALPSEEHAYYRIGPQPVQRVIRSVIKSEMLRKLSA